MPKSVALKPHLSEKAYAQSEELNTYVFVVPPETNRQAVSDAVTKQYKVTVEAVRISSLPAKTKRTYRRKGRVVHKGTTSATRKAYVRLKEGDKLPIFAATDENKKPEKESK